MFRYLLASGTTVDLLGPLLGKMNSALSGLTAVGAGLASVFILIVIFVYTSKILEGGKFEAKMLLPLFIYLAVSNFGVVKGVVLPFTQGISKGCLAAVGDSRKKALQDMAGGDSDVSTLSQAMMAKLKKEHASNMDAASDKLNGDDKTEDDNTDSGENQDFEDNDQKKLFGGITSVIQKIASLPQSLWDKFMDKLKEMFLFMYKAADLHHMALKYSLWFVLIGAMQILLDIMSFAMQALGAVMICIIMAFGPITWAFAVIPGNAGVIKSWFIRLCQFSLYGPIIAVINTFMVIMCDTLSGSGSSESFTSVGSDLLNVAMVLCGLFANFIALTSVPSIASMIIEGATGNVNSLSSGAQILGSTVGAPISMATKFITIGEKGRDVQQGATLSSIDNTLKQMAGNGGFGGGGGGGVGGGGVGGGGVGGGGGTPPPSGNANRPNG